MKPATASLLALLLLSPIGLYSDAFSPQEHQKILDQAEELFQATLFEQAIPYYLKLEGLSRQEKLSKEESFLIRCRLGEAFFYSSNFLDASAWLKNALSSGKDLSATHQTDLAECQLFLAVSYRHLRKPQEALALLESHEQVFSSTHFDDEKEFEMGLDELLLDRKPAAKTHFEKLIGKVEKPYLFFLSSLYLSKIYLEEGLFKQAESILQPLPPSIPASDPLQQEIAFLLGRAFFGQEYYEKAAEYFEESLEQKEGASPQDSDYFLGWSYFKLAEDPSKALSERKGYYEKAIAAFQKRLDLEETDERAALSLAECYLAQRKALGDESAFALAEAVLANPVRFSTIPTRTKAERLLAEAAPSYEKKEYYLSSLTSQGNASSQDYALGWYLRGMNHYEEAKRQIRQTPLLYEQAEIAFLKAFELFKQDDPKLAANCLQHAVESCWSQQTIEAKKRAFLLFESLIADDTMTSTFETPNDIYTLFGSYALHLVHAHSCSSEYLVLCNESVEEKFEFESSRGSTIVSGSALMNTDPLTIVEPRGFETKIYAQNFRYRVLESGERALAKAAEGNQSGPGKDRLIHTLASLYLTERKYLEAKQAFLLLAQEFPLSPLAPQALLHASTCMEHLMELPEKVSQLRRSLYEDYPESAEAPLAYFLTFSTKEYLQGGRAAIKHLNHLKERYPDTPFVIQAAYLIGLDFRKDRKTAEGKLIRKKDLNEAIEAFFDAQEQFDRLFQSHLIPEEVQAQYAELRYRAAIDRGLANYLLADEAEGVKRTGYLQAASSTFEKIHTEFQPFPHPPASALLTGVGFHPLQEEALFWWSQTAQKQGDDKLLEAILEEASEKYRAAKINSGYYLSKLLIAKGLLAMRFQDFELAWQSFMRAEEAAKDKYLSIDEKLDLWIQQSICYKELNLMDQSMLILSKVINDDAISGLRLKAMYMRAEIYEMQGRIELAKKQLEALSKKGGDWAQKAKIKLETVYGY